MDPALAEQIVADFIERQFGGDYPDSYGRELAVDAILNDRPAILSTGKHHNHFALNATYAVNKGGSLEDYIHGLARTQRRDLRSTADGTIDALVGVNALGRSEIRMAKSIFAAPLAQAAE